MHHALMWNIGTTGSMVSPADRLSASGTQIDIALSVMARCEYSAPLGLPVVPDV
jgi:hypothetical protein